MDFQNSADINMDILDFWMSVFNYPYKCEYPHWYPSRDIHTRTFCNGVVNQSSIIYAFMDIHLDILEFLWISMHWLAMDSRFTENRFTCALWLRVSWDRNLTLQRVTLTRERLEVADSDFDETWWAVSTYHGMIVEHFKIGGNRFWVR